jgi:hypothetical protein
MQMWAGRKAGIAGVGDVLPARYVLADSHANRIPMQVGVDANRSVTVNYLYDICLVKHDRSNSAS